MPDSGVTLQPVRLLHHMGPDRRRGPGTAGDKMLQILLLNLRQGLRQPLHVLAPTVAQQPGEIVPGMATALVRLRLEQVRNQLREILKTPGAGVDIRLFIFF